VGVAPTSPLLVRLQSFFLNRPRFGTPIATNPTVPITIKNDWRDIREMNLISTDRAESFALFTQAAERYCLGLSNSAMRSYALKYMTFLQARSQGADQEEPKNGRASSFDCVLIRSYLTKLYRDHMDDHAQRAA